MCVSQCVCVCVCLSVLLTSLYNQSRLRQHPWIASERIHFGKVYCIVLQCVAACCSVLQYDAGSRASASTLARYIAVCCSVLQRVTVRCWIASERVHFVQIYCSVLQYDAGSRAHPLWQGRLSQKPARYSLYCIK